MSDSLTLEMDAEDFNVEDYLKQTLRERSIDDILAIDNQLKKEVRHISTSLKTLVQNNFYKFAIAGETLTKVNSSLASIDDRVRSVQEKLDFVGKLNSDVSDRLDTNAEKLQEVAGAHAFVEQIKVIAKVPDKLEQAHQTPLKSKDEEKDLDPSAMSSFEIHTSAIRAYVQMIELLAPHREIATFSTLLRRSSDCAEKLKTSYHDIFNNLETPPARLLLSSALLLMMQVPALDLARQFLSVYGSPLMATLKKWRVFTINPATPDEPKQQTYSRFTSGLHREFISPLLVLVQLFNSIFLSKDSLAAKVDGLEACLKNELDVIFDEYSQTLAEQLLRSNSAQAIISCIKLVDHEIREAADHPTRLPIKIKIQPEVTTLLRERLPQVIMTLSSMIVARQFIISRERLSIMTSSCAKTPTLEVIQSSQKDFAAVLSDIIDFVGPMAIGLKSEDFTLTLVDQLSVLLSDPFNAVAEEWMNKEPSKEEIESTASTCLAIAVLLHLITDKWLPEWSNKLDAAINSTNTKRSDRSPFIDKISLRLKALENALTRRCVDLRSSTLKEMVNLFFYQVPDQVSRWKSTSNPASVDTAVQLMAEELIALKSKTDSVLSHPSLSANDDASANLGRSTTITSSFGLVGPFADSHFDSSVPLSGSELFIAVCRGTMREFYSKVKALSFSKGGYQQMQVNIAFFKQTLGIDQLKKGPASASPSEQLRQIFDEILETAGDRCEDPEPLDPKEVQRICRESQTQL